MTQGLQVSRLIDVSVNLEPAAAQEPSVTTALFIGSTNVINTQERFRSYADITEVADDFGISAPEYLAAVLFFGQDPQPEQLYIGRWAETATHGLLICGELNATQQLISNWTSITNGSFHIQIDAVGSPVSITAVNLSGAVNLNGVATLISTALAAATVAATCVWNGEQFTFISTSTGAASKVLPLTAGTGGTNIATQLRGTLAEGADEVDGIVAESALTALQIMDTQPFSFYMVMYASTDLMDSDIEAIAAYVEADANPHIYGLTVQDANALNPASTADIGYILKQLEYERTAYQYSGTNPYAFASIFGRMATVEYDGQNTTITVMYKQEPGVTPEILLSTQANSLDAKNYSYYATFNNGVPIIVNGTMSNGMYLDDIQGADWMVSRIQTDVFNLLFTTPTKIPQTNAGVHQIVTTINGSLSQGVVNGQIGPGVWEFDGFGTLNKGDFLENGFYVYGPPISSQTEASRLARQSPPIQAAVIFAGAVQKVGILINVQR